MGAEGQARIPCGRVHGVAARKAQLSCTGAGPSAFARIPAIVQDMAATKQTKLIAFAPSELALYFQNPNLGNVPTIKTSLKVHGQYKPVVVNRGTHTGRPNEVLAGNHTLKAIRELLAEEPDNAAWRTIDGYVIDVDNDQAAAIVLVDNKSAEDGFGYDSAILADILGGLPTLEGTAFTADEYSDLLASLEEALPPALDPAGLGDDVSIKPPRTGEDGLINSTDIDTQANSYVDASTRLVVLTVPIPQFIWMQEILTRYRNEHDLDSNTWAVLQLLQDWSGELAPALPVEYVQAQEEVL